MPNLIIQWEVAGDVQMHHVFSNLALDLKDLRVPLRRFGDEVIYPEIRRQFAEEGSPPWPRLSAPYAAWKSRHGGGKILHLTGALERSLTNKSALGAIYRLEKMLLEIGTDLKVGKYNLGLIHQKPLRPAMPERVMITLPPAAQTKGIIIFRDWIDEKLRREGVGI